MTTTQQALDAARLLGRRAAQANRGIESCPYPADGTSVQRAAARAWVRAYRHWRPPGPGETDYQDDVAALADGPDQPDTDQPTQGAAQGIVLGGAT